MKGFDPDDIDGRDVENPTLVGRGLEGWDLDVDWKVWKGRRLDLDVVVGRVGSGRQLEGDWKGWIRTLLLERDWIRP